MEIKGKVHCLFEQSGTFKREFIRLGVPAIDYAIYAHNFICEYVLGIIQESREGYLFNED